MTEGAPDLGPSFAELEGTISKLADMAGQAAQQYADGDVQWACNLINLMHYDIASFENVRNALLARFTDMGLEPGLDR